MSLLDQLRERKSQQFSLLFALYERRDNDRLDPVALGMRYGVARESVERAARFADEEGLIQRHPEDSGRIGLSAAGVALVEAAIAKPSQGTEHFPALVTLDLPARVRARLPGVEPSDIEPPIERRAVR